MKTKVLVGPASNWRSVRRERYEGNTPAVISTVRGDGPEFPTLQNEPKTRFLSRSFGNPKGLYVVTGEL